MATRKVPVIKTSSKKLSLPSTKRSQVVHKKQVDVKDIFTLLGETERTIQELTRMFAELPASSHKGVGGKRKLTEKEKFILNEVAAARERAKRLLKLIERQ